MAPPTATKKRKNVKSTTSDFKRIKAKVGKKAIKLNDTDVSFKAAALHVAGQQSIFGDKNNKGKASSDDTIDSINLISSRGKSVDELVGQFGHPAAAVRSSALKGILDIVKNVPDPKRLLPYLSILIPSCIHTCVDEDEDVRRVGIDVVVALLSPHSTHQIQPFGPLIMARVASSLHSLDAATRQDGVRLCHQISSKFPSLVFPSTHRLLPSFVHLLSDSETKSTLDETLLALVSVLRAATSTTDSATTAKSKSNNNNNNSGSNMGFDSDTPDLIYKSGGRSQNSVVVLGRSNQPPSSSMTSSSSSILSLDRRNVRCIESLWHLPVIEDESSRTVGIDGNDSDDDGDDFNIEIKINAKNESSSSSFTSSVQIIQSNLLEKLRDVLLESMHDDSSVDIIGGIAKKSDTTKRQQKSSSTSRARLERSVVVLRAVRLLYRSYLLDIENNITKNNITCSNDTLEATAQHVLSISMEIFPVTDDSDDAGDDDYKNGSGNRFGNDMNAAIVATLLDVGFIKNRADQRRTLSAQDNKRDEMWLRMALTYILPRIVSSIVADLNSSSTDLEITCKLVRHLSQHNVFPSALLKLLQSVEDSIFSVKDDCDVALSVVGRKFFLLMMELAEDDTNLPSLAIKSPKSEILARIVLMAPFYLGVWSNRYLYESYFVLCKMKSIIQRADQHEACALVGGLRKQFIWLVRQADGDNAMIGNGRKSVLESYPSSLQRRTLGMMVLLQAPDGDCVRCLSSICSQHWGDSSTVLTDGMIDAVQSIRTTLSMKDYFTFLIGCIGLPNQTKELKRKISKSGLSLMNFDEIFGQLDLSLKSVSSTLVHCGPARILPMILPQLISWLSPGSDKIQTSHQSLSSLVKMRTSIVILAYLSLAFQNICSFKEVSLFSDATNDIGVPFLIDAVWNFLYLTVSNEFLANVQARMLSPLVGLMASDNTVLVPFLAKLCSDWFQTGQLHRTQQLDILTLLQNWVSDLRICHAIARKSQNKQLILQTFEGLLGTEVANKDTDINSKIKQLIVAVEFC